MNILFHISGYIGSFFLSLLLLPQVLKVRKTKTVEGLSRKFLIFQLFTCIFWITYGIGFILNYQYFDGGIILLSNISIIIFTSILLFYFKKYSKNNNKITDSSVENNNSKIRNEDEIYHRK